MIKPADYPLKVILGSGSPRRKHLMEELGFNITVSPIDVNEVYPAALSPKEVVVYLAALKAFAYGEVKEGEVLVTADTVVGLGNSIIEKPKNEDDAVRMISALSKVKHDVYSGVQIKTATQNISLYSHTEVYFKALTPETIRYYVDTYKPLDKAGAYGIQEWIGLVGVKKIEGCFYNVMGLPVHKVYHELMKLVE